MKSHFCYKAHNELKLAVLTESDPLNIIKLQKKKLNFKNLSYKGGPKNGAKMAQKSIIGLK